MAADHLSAATLRELIDYDPKAGVFTWKRRPLSMFKNLRACEAWNGRYAHKLAGGLSGLGHISIRVNDRAFWAHRLAFLHMTGQWPQDEVDHINGVKTDNRYANLRDVSGAVNRQNIRLPLRTRKSDLPLGVYHHARLVKTPFSASLHVGDRNMFLGYHATAEAAHEAYVIAKRIYHAGCTI